MGFSCEEAVCDSPSATSREPLLSVPPCSGGTTCKPLPPLGEPLVSAVGEVPIPLTVLKFCCPQERVFTKVERGVEERSLH